jgi:hypothetical protein
MWFVATITLRRFVAGSGRRPPHQSRRSVAPDHFCLSPESGGMADMAALTLLRHKRAHARSIASHLIRLQSVTFTYFVRFRSIFQAQSPLLKDPSSPSSTNFPMRGCQPIVAPIVPSSRTVPLMFCASASILAWPVTTVPSTVSVTIAGLQRPSVAVAEPVHSPSYGPAAQASWNCDENSR